MKVRVLGLGNVLMSDDGFGPFVVEHLLATCAFPDGVEVIDVGTPGLDLIPYVTGADALVIVDTVRSNGAPGELRQYRKAAILAHLPQPRLSPHDPGLKEALLSADFAGSGAREVLLVGAIPGDVGMGAALTPPLRKAVDEAARAVVVELARLGVPATPRPAPGDTRPWWTRHPADESRP
jgi:hydrogenase maturation protease